MISCFHEKCIVLNENLIVTQDLLFQVNYWSCSFPSAHKNPLLIFFFFCFHLSKLNAVISPWHCWPEPTMVFCLKLSVLAPAFVSRKTCISKTVQRQMVSTCFYQGCSGRFWSLDSWVWKSLAPLLTIWVTRGRSNGLVSSLQVCCGGSKCWSYC